MPELCYITVHNFEASSCGLLWFEMSHLASMSPHTEEPLIFADIHVVKK